MSDHTKGPWEVQKGAGWLIKRPDAVGRREAAMAVGMTPAVTLVGSPDPWFDDNEARANAYLMAASPELLQSLIKMERLIVELYPGHLEPEPDQVGEYQAVWNAVMESRAAIAKAEGK